jgi:hypothetical protein
MLIRGGGKDLVCSNIGDTLCQPALRTSTTDWLAGSEKGNKVEPTFAANLDCSMLLILQTSHNDFITYKAL